MGWSILVYKSGSHYVPFSIADLMFYDMMKDVLSTEEGVKRYGMKFIAGRRNIPDDKIDAVSDLVSKLIGRINDGESIDLEKELTKTE